MRGKLSGQGNLFVTPLRELLNPQQPLYRLADRLDWRSFEDSFSGLYSSTGRPSHPIRLMVGLLILKRLYNLGDETVVERWVENPYFQYFCGMVNFQWGPPIDPSDLVYFRKRIGEEGAELILKASIDLFEKSAREKEIVIDSSVQHKAITYPTDAKLHKRIIEWCRRIAGQEGFKLWRSYTRTVPQLIKAQHNARHPRRRKSARKAARELRTIAGRLVREVERKLSQVGRERWKEKLEIFHQVLGQTRHSKNKVYAVHAPEVACIAKGKAHPKYEYGSKVSIAMTKTDGIIVAAVNFQGNPYDGNTVQATLDQYQRNLGCLPRVVIADRGYRGKKNYGETQVLTPGKPKPDASAYTKRKARKRFRRRTAIEPVIGHLKTRFRLNRNWLKGTTGDQINLLLSSTAWNLKKWMNKIPDPDPNAFWAWLRRAVVQMRAAFATILIRPGAKISLVMKG